MLAVVDYSVSCSKLVFEMNAIKWIVTPKAIKVDQKSKKVDRTYPKVAPNHFFKMPLNG